MLELSMLALSALLYQFIWFPSTIAKLSARGIEWIESNRSKEGVAELPEWGKRAQRAQANYFENFAPFAVVVLALAQLDAFTYYTGVATVFFFLGRLGHVCMYTIGVVYPRTAFYTLGLVSTLYLYYVLFQIVGIPII